MPEINHAHRNAIHPGARAIPSPGDDLSSPSSIAFFNLLLFMTSGAFYPVIGIPGWLSLITVINPEYYAVHALRSIILRGQGITVIGTDLTALSLFSLGAIMPGIMTHRRTLE